MARTASSVSQRGRDRVAVAASHPHEDRRLPEQVQPPGGAVRLGDDGERSAVDRVADRERVAAAAPPAVHREEHHAVAREAVERGTKEEPDDPRR
jgi:hypothetical protein